MDKRKFLEMMKNLQSIMRCPSCGSVYGSQEMQYVGQQDGYFLLSLTCGQCSLPVWVNVFSGHGNVRPMTDLTVMDFGLTSREPISKNEVIDFYKEIKKFDGDFKRAFGS